MVLTLSFALSPVTGLCCHRRRRNCFRQLDASVGASGPHDFAVRISAPFVSSTSASIASLPTFVTIAKRPSVWAGMARDMEVIWVKSERKYFCKRGWTCRSVICPSGSQLSIINASQRVARCAAQRFGARQNVSAGERHRRLCRRGGGAFQALRKHPRGGSPGGAASDTEGPSDVLDIGSGTGRDAAWFARWAIAWSLSSRRMRCAFPPWRCIPRRGSNGSTTACRILLSQGTRRGIRPRDADGGLDASR